MSVPGEPPFVGESRQLLVDGLERLFDQVAASEEPLWVSLEAPSSWGKTRVAHELYKRLAARQSSPAYWPASINDNNDTAEPGSRRKRSHPEVHTIPAGAMPEWVWLGISCERRKVGSPAAALRLDIGQLQMHLPSLEDRWRQSVPLSTRFARWAKSHRPIAAAAAGEGIAMLLPLPGLGLAKAAASAAGDAVRDAKERRARQAHDYTLDRHSDDELFAAEVAEQLARLALPSLPLMVFVEDLHLADAMLIDVLARLLVAASASAMVITSCWPDHLTTVPSLAQLTARIPASRTVRVGPDAPNNNRLPAGSGLDDLGTDDRRQIARACMPTADDHTVTLIADRFVSPLSIELFCSLGKFRRATERGDTIHLDQAEVESAAPKVHDMLRAVWADLPPAVRTVLTLAALGAPTSISDKWSNGDDRWHALAVSEAISASGLLEDETGQAPKIGAASSAYGWARASDEWLRNFVEADQRMVALEHANHELSNTEILRFRRLLAHFTLRLGGDLSNQQLQHRSRMIIALHSAQLIEPAIPEIADAALSILDLDEYLPPGERLRLADLAGRVGRAVGIDRGKLLLARKHRAMAVTDLNKVSTHELSVNSTLAQPDSAPLLTAFYTACRDEGFGHEPDLALPASPPPPSPLPPPSRPTAPTSLGRIRPPWTLRQRRRRVTAHPSPSRSGTSRRAPAMSPIRGPRRPLPSAPVRPPEWPARPSLEMPTRRYSSGAKQSMLLRWMRRLFGFKERILRTPSPAEVAPTQPPALPSPVEFHQPASQPQSPLEAPCPPSSPSAPLAESEASQPGWGISGLVGSGPIGELEELLVDQLRAFGPSHPDTLSTRENLANLMGESGRTVDAIGQLAALLSEHARILGPDHPDTLTTRGNLAHWTAAGGRIDDAIDRLASLVDDQSRVLGPDHPDTLTTRGNLAHWIAAGGRIDDAIDQYRSLLDDRIRIVGPDHPDTLRILDYLGSCLGQAGRVDDAIEQFRSLLADQTRILGADHPDTSTTRSKLTTLLNAR